MQQENWTSVIESRSSISFYTLKEVWQYRDLLWMFVKRDMVTNYKQTILGPLWFFIQPALTTALFVFINKAAKTTTNGIHPILFYLIGVTAWSYFAECLTKTSTTFKDNAYIFGKVYFPRLILPLSIIVSGLLKFFIQFSLFLATLISFLIIGNTEVHIQPTILLIPVLIFIMAGLGLGGGMIITSLTTKYRDLALLIQFGVQLLMYGTLAVPLNSIKDPILYKIMLSNPMIPIINTFRQAFFNDTIFSLSNLLYSCLVMVILLLIGFYTFSKTEKTFTDTV
ncbi:MAG: ABC transporter permease [Chitinophagales bacterium]|nr:ABC transporter permease [Bacteroidota bacterium]